MWRRIFLLFLLALFSIPLVTHIYLGSYSRLAADDFCSAAVAQSQGIVRGAFYWYMNWTGRYGADLLDTLFAYIGPRAIPYQTGLVVIAWFGTLAFAGYQIIRGDEPELRVLLSCFIASMVLFTLFAVIPSIGQSLYWAQVRAGGVPALILGTVYIGLIARRRATSTNNKRWLLAAGLLTFIASGFAETYVAMQTTALVFALVIVLISNHYSAPTKRRHLLLLVAGLAGSLVGGLLMFVAPGNKFRRTPFPPPPGVPDLLRISMRGLREFFYVVVFSPTRAPVWVGLILSGFVCGLGIFQRDHRSGPEARHLIPALLWLPPVTFVLLIACWVPMAWGTSLTLANRTFIIPAYVLVCLVVSWAYLAGRLCRRSYQLFAPHLHALLTALPIVTLAVFGLFAVNRSWQMLQLRPTLAAYSREWTNREQLIQRAKSQGLSYVVVPRLQHWAGLDEIELDPKITWLTKCFKDYYGISVVPELGDLSGEADGEIKQTALENQFESIHILPGSIPAELNGIYKTRRGKAGFYKIDLPPDKIRSYYDTELARLGWKYIGTKPVEALQRYSGGTQNLFCNGETAATLFITAGDEQRLRYTYSLALNWGMSSGYVWGVVDCPR